MQSDAHQLTSLHLQRRAVAALRHAMAHGADRALVHGYELFVRSRPDVFFRTVALPHSQECCDTRAILALEQKFRSSRRGPKIEFFEDLFPRLETELSRHGWQLERKAAALQLQEFIADLGSNSIEWLDRHCDDVHLAAFLSGMAKAYNEAAAIAESEVECLRNGLTTGRILAACHRRGDDICAGAALSIAQDTAELQGVWTATAERRQGLAKHLCGQLLKRFLAKPGRMVWLSVGGPESFDLYKKLGFDDLGTQINMQLI